MNERIDQLWAQALDAAVPETYTRLSHSQVLKIKQVFAHMIVRECLSVIEEMNPHDPERDIDDIFDEVKEHFGVEE